jgi:hypothetical protein
VEELEQILRNHDDLKLRQTYALTLKDREQAKLIEDQIWLAGQGEEPLNPEWLDRSHDVDEALRQHGNRWRPEGLADYGVRSSQFHSDATAYRLPFIRIDHASQNGYVAILMRGLQVGALAGVLHGILLFLFTELPAPDVHRTTRCASGPSTSSA